MKNSSAKILTLWSIWCTAKGCYLTVGHVKSDMIGSERVLKGRSAISTGNQGVKVSTEKYWIQRKDVSHLSSHSLEVIATDTIHIMYGNFVPRTEGFKLFDFASWVGSEIATFVDVMRFIISPPIINIFVPLASYS